jgi:hypothetical protein
MRLMFIKGWKGGKKGMVGSWKMESPDELQEYLIKKYEKGMSLRWSRQES